MWLLSTSTNPKLSVLRFPLLFHLEVLDYICDHGYEKEFAKKVRLEKKIEVSQCVLCRKDMRYPLFQIP